MKLPKIFTKKEKDRRFNDDNSVDIPVYGPHDDLLPRMYSVSVILAEFEDNFERTCKEFLKSTDLDKFNLGYVDAMIEKRVNEALDSLDIQEVGHHDVIDELTRVRMGDMFKGQAKLAEIEKEANEVNVELEKLERIYHAGTALEDEPETTRIVRMEDMKNEESAA